MANALVIVFPRKKPVSAQHRITLALVQLMRTPSMVTAVLETWAETHAGEGTEPWASPDVTILM